MRIGYLHIGRKKSGVTRYGRLLARQAKTHPELDVLESTAEWTGHGSKDLRRIEAAAEELSHASIVHLQYNQKTWGTGKKSLRHLLAFLRRCRTSVLATLHDVYLDRPVPLDGHRVLQWAATAGRIAGVNRNASNRRAARTLLEKVATVVVSSQDEARRLSGLNHARTVNVVPHFVEQRDFCMTKEAAKESLQLVDRRVITLLGYIHRRKGHVMALDTLATLSDDVILVCAGGAAGGDEWFVDALAKRARQLGVADRLRVTGYLEDDELDKYLIATDLAICPFQTVSASGSISTWLAAGKPIVASNLPLIQEYNAMEPGAIEVFHPYTPDALSSDIQRLLATCGDEPHAPSVRLREMLSLDKTLDRYVALYRDTAAGTATGRPRQPAADATRGSGFHASLRAAFLPEYQGNPYQLKLRQGLSTRGVGMIHLGRTGGSVATSLLRRRPHILHLHWLDALYVGVSRRPSALKLALSWMGLTLMRMLGTRIVWTVHNLGHHEHLAPRLDRWINRWAARKADALITHSEAAKRLAANAFAIKDVERIHVIPHGHYVGVYTDEIERGPARRELGLGDTDLVFLFLGQVRPYKGLTDLIEAFKKLDAPGVRLLIAGKPRNGQDTELLDGLVNEDNRITFSPGFVPDERIQTYMNACDAVVLPYRDVLTSGAAILAMSFARACIAPRLGCLQDLFVDGGGFLYDADDPQGLHAALVESIARRDELEAMGARNREHVAPWTWDHVAEMTHNVYNAVMSR